MVAGGRHDFSPAANLYFAGIPLVFVSLTLSVLWWLEAPTTFVVAGSPHYGMRFIVSACVFHDGFADDFVDGGDAVEDQF